MIPLDSFVGQSADGKMVPIIPGGNSIPLTFSNRKEYVERAIEYRLHEMDRQVRLNTSGVHVNVCLSLQTRIDQLLPNFCILIYCVDSFLSIFQLLFRDYSGHISWLLSPYSRPYVGQHSSGIEAKLSPSPSDPALSLLLISYCSLPHGPHSSFVSQGSCEGTPEC